MHSDIDTTLLAQVDEPTRAALIALRDYEPEGEVDLTTRLTLNAVEAAGFGGHRGLIPLPHELTDTQRAVARFLARFDRVRRFGGHAIPSEPWKVRRWLGLDGYEGEPRVFEREVRYVDPDGAAHDEPLWRALLRIEHARGDARAFVLGLGLSTVEILEAFLDAYLCAYDVRRPREPWVNPTAIDGSLGAWAAGAADRLLDTPHGSTTVTIKVPVVLALVRGGETIEPRWDPLFFAGEKLVSLMEECFAALPDERRDAAIVGAVRCVGVPADKFRVGLEISKRWPSAPLTELLIAIADRVADAPRRSRITKAQQKKMMAGLAKRHAVVARVWERHLAGEPAPIQLELLESVRLTAAHTLPATLRGQIEAAGKLFDGRTMTARQRLEADVDDERSFRDRLELRRLRDTTNGNDYDAFLVEPDSGSVFVAGTTDAVALVIQAAVQCDDSALRDALREALG